MKRIKRLIICRIVLATAVAAIAPAAQASPIDMTGEDFRYLHDQAVAEAKARSAAAADARRVVSQQRPRRPRMYDSLPVTHVRP